MKFLVSTLFVFLALWVGSVAAHHGTYEYDFNTVAHIEGTITEYHWRNPHAFIHLSHRNEAGATVELVIEAAGPSGLIPLGVTSSSFTPGERVVAVVSPAGGLPQSPLTAARSSNRTTRYCRYIHNLRPSIFWRVRAPPRPSSVPGYLPRRISFNCFSGVPNGR